MNLRALIVICLTLLSQVRAGENVLVSAAASLREPLTEIARGRAVTFNFGASGALQQQIENGAPVDIFISAAPRQMDALEKSGLLAPGSRRDLLRNELALVTARESGIQTFANLATPAVKKIALGEPKSVPVGAYAEEVFRSLKLLDALKPKFVYAADARQVLAFVESRDAEAGLVYVTDARASRKVQMVAQAPEGSHSPIVYPIAILKAAPHRAEAAAVVEHLLSAGSAQVFERGGFMIAH